MEKLRKTKTLGLIGNILVIVSLFCTWIVMSSNGEVGSVSARFIEESADGKWALILSAISLIIIYAENMSPKFFKGLTNVKLTLIPTVIELLMVVNYISKINRVMKLDVANLINYHFGIGFYLMCAGIVILLVFPFIYKQEKKEQ